MKIKNIAFLLTFVGFLAFQACELPDNVNPKGATEVPAESLFINAQFSLAEHVGSVNVNQNISRLLAQYSAQTTYFSESRYNFIDRNIPDGYWAEIFRDVLVDLKETKAIVDATEAGISDADRAAMLAAIDVLEVYGYHMLVDAFGDVPYEQALGGSTTPTPVYDDAETIYKALIVRLTADATAFGLGGNAFGSNDLMFGGDAGQWLLFTNSLKLRLGMRLADVDNAAAEKAVVEAVTSGVFTSGVAAMTYIGANPYQSPLYEHYYVSNRKDYIVANTLVDKMHELADPRMDLYFDATIPFSYRTDDNNTKIDSTFESGSFFLYYSDRTVYATAPFTILAIDSLDEFSYYVGGEYGSSNSYYNYSHFDAQMLTAEYATVLSDNVEVEFLLAEAVERGYAVGGTAEEHYNNAITASILAWGGASADATAYLADAAVAYTTATGDYKTKIGTQKWIALYNRGVEAWAEARRLDAPTFYVPNGLTAADIPMRMPYPFNEENLNKDNKDAAATAIGGDAVATKLFWDVN